MIVFAVGFRPRITWGLLWRSRSFLLAALALGFNWTSLSRFGVGIGRFRRSTLGIDGNESLADAHLHSFFDMDFCDGAGVRRWNGSHRFLRFELHERLIFLD